MLCLEFLTAQYSHVLVKPARPVLRCPPMDDAELTPIEQTEKLPRFSRPRDGFNRMDIVQAFTQAFELIGGTTRLTLWANKNPDKFYPLFAKLLPSTSLNITDPNGTLIIEHSTPTTDLDNHDAYKNQLSAPQALSPIPHEEPAVVYSSSAPPSGENSSGD